MKKKSLLCYILIILFFFLSIVMLLKTNQNKIDKIYLLYGENNHIEIKNGYITKSNNLVNIDFGIFNFNLDAVKSSTMTVYIDLNGNKENIFTKSLINNSSHSVSNLHNNSIGTCKRSFNEKEFKSLIDNLYFTLEYIDVNDNSNQTTTKLYLKALK